MKNFRSGLRPLILAPALSAVALLVGGCGEEGGAPAGGESTPAATAPATTPVETSPAPAPAEDTPAMPPADASGTDANPAEDANN